MKINRWNTRFRFKVLAASVAFSSLWFTPSANASNLTSELRDMFSNVTQPGSFETLLRSGWAGGGIGIRGPIKNINIISFDPPRLSAGCGGIDFFGGSFSFINSDQLIALFRSIAMNAVGVAFKAAIDAINPLLGSIMQDFQAIVQSLNLGNANTCAIASTIINKSMSLSGAESSAKSVVVGEQTALGRFADTLASYTKGWFTDSQSETRDAAKDPKFPEIGNWTWKALGNSKVARDLPDPITGETDTKAGKEFVMSVIGTVIIGAEPNTGSSTDDGRSAAPSVSRHPPTIKLDVLRDGVREKLGMSTGDHKIVKKMRCEEVAGGSSTIEDGACDKIRYANIGSDFTGIKGYVSKMFFGQESGMAGSATPDSIVSKMFYCTDSTSAACGLTAEQRNFMASLQGPAIELFIKTMNNQNMAMKTMDLLIPVVANEYYIAYLNLFEEVARTAYSGGGQQPVPDFVREVMDQLHVMRVEATQEANESLDTYLSIAEYVNHELQSRERPFHSVGAN